MFIINFNPNRCNICYNNAITSTLNVALAAVDTDQNIKYCTACKLVGYCSQEHQSLDWKVHKDMCRAIQKLMKEKKIEHILDINKPIKSASKKDFEEAIIVIKYLLVGILKRQLLAFEEKMITFPKVCNECYEYDPKKLEECKNCHNWFFCCDKHNNTDEHKVVCEELRLEFMLTTGEKRNS
jgi:MYND finger